MRGPLDVHRRLLAAEVPHEIVHLSTRLSAAAELPEALGVPADRCAVVHVVLADDAPCALVLAAGAGWSPTRVAATLRARTLRAADAAEASTLTEFSAGLISPVALPQGLVVVVDADLAGEDVVYAPAGDPTTALKIRSRDLLDAAGAVVDALAEPVHLPTPRPTADPWPVARFVVPTG